MDDSKDFPAVTSLKISTLKQRYNDDIYIPGSRDNNDIYIPGSRDNSVTSDEESSICLSSPEYQFMSSDDEEGL